MFWKAFVLSSTAVVVKSDLARFVKAQKKEKKKEKGKQAFNSLTISELFFLKITISDEDYPMVINC